MYKGRFFPPDFVEKVRISSDLADVVASYTSLKKHGKNHQGCCPFHDDKTPSFTVSSDKQIYTCFTGCEGSGGTGDVFQFIMRKENLNFQESVEFLAKRLSISLPDVKEHVRDANELARDKNLSDLFEIFKHNIEDYASEFEHLISNLGLNTQQLTDYGFRLGFTGHAATEINKAYESQDKSVIYQAQKLGLLNANGVAPFQDNSLVFFLGEQSSDGLGLIDSDGCFSYLPIRAHQYNDQVFGLKHFNSNAIAKVDGVRRVVGDRVYVAPTPLFALQMLSNGIPNVLAPVHKASYSLPAFQSRIAQLGNKMYSPVISYIVNDSLITNSATISAICANGVNTLPIIVKVAGDVDSSHFDFFRAANESLSYEEVIESKPEYNQALALISSADVISNVILSDAIKQSGIQAADEIFGAKRDIFIEAFTHCCNAQLGDTPHYDFIVNRATSKLGIGKAEFLSHKYPGIEELSSKRMLAVNYVLGAGIADTKFAERFSSDSVFTSIESLPSVFTPNEKLNLAMYCIETTEAALAPQFNVNSHILGFPSLIEPDDLSGQQSVKAIIKSTLLHAKTSKKTIAQVGNEALELLAEIEANLPYEMSILLKYQNQVQIEQAHDQADIYKPELELIDEINNNVVNLRR